VVVLAVWGGLIIGAVYMTRAIRNVLHGPLPQKFSELPDAYNLWRKIPYALLLVSLLVFGFVPKLLTEKINPAADKVLATAGLTHEGQNAVALAGLQTPKTEIQN
jgi:NADH-quinone oxidoreductase subunit M